MESIKVLFIVRSFEQSAPQPIRFQKITSYLKNSFDIHVLMLYYGDEKQYLEKNGLKLHKIPYSKVGRWINKKPKTHNNKPEKNYINKKSFFRSLLIKLNIRSWIFPDSLIFEIGSLRKELRQLIASYNFEIVVGSSFPHTTLMLSETAKRVNKDIKWVHDIGDPCYSPLNGYKLKALFSYLYENYYSKFVDKLVVTNLATKDYYINRYKHYSKKNVNVVQMGAEIQNKKNIEKRFELPLKMIYAGTFYDKLREPFEMYKAVAECSEIVQLNLFGNIPSKHLPKQKIENIKYNGIKLHEDLVKSYTNTDIVLYIDNAYGLQTPGKVFEVISAVKPVLCIYENEHSASLEYFKKLPYAVLCKNKKEEIISGINQIVERIKKNDLKFDNDLKRFNWENRAMEFKCIINDLIQ